MDKKNIGPRFRELFGSRRIAQSSKNLWGICVCLRDGPRTLEEIKVDITDSSEAISQRLGFFRVGEGLRRRDRRYIDDLPGDLEAMTSLGWVTKQDGRYSLTDAGRDQAEQVTGKARAFFNKLDALWERFTKPEAASILTLITQAVLAAIKLPAGLVSGSVGLINDSLDTIQDVVCSLLVYLGLKYNRERAVSYILVVLMVGTGLLSLFEAVHRFIQPYVPEVQWFPFIAAVLSAVVGFGLWTYQCYVGLHGKSMALITQSVDARNHVIVATGVTLGLVASLAHFGILDMLVGLGVALLILWSGIELARDLLRANKEGEPDLSRYGLWLKDAYERLRREQLRDWILLLVQKREVQTRAELFTRIDKALDFRNNRWLKAVGLDQQAPDENLAAPILDDLILHGEISENETGLHLTVTGESHLHRVKRSRHTARNAIKI